MSKKEKLVVEHFVVIDVKQLDDLILENSKLKQQLTKKVKTIEVLRDLQKYNTTQLAEKQNVIDDINKKFVQAVHDWKILCKKKDKEIETMKKDSDKNIDYLVEFASLIENEKDCNRMLKALDRVKSGNKYIIDKANQSKTEFAIQELEKVKNFVDGRTYCADYINKRIQELKGE